MRTFHRRPPGDPGRSACAAPEPLPPGGFEESLLAELKLVVAEHAAGAPPATPQRVPAAARGRLAVAGALSVALAAGLAIAVTWGGGGRTAGQSPPPQHITLAAAFLGRAAAAVHAQPAPAHRPGQIWHINEISVGDGKGCMLFWQSAPYTDGPIHMVTAPIASCRSVGTLPPPPPPLSKDPVVRYEQLQYEKNGAVWGPHAYPAPGSLPTQPAALRAALEKAASRDTKAGVNYYDFLEQDYVPGHPAATQRIIFFQLVGRLLMAPISGTLRAALYETIAALPGVRLIPHVKDAAGRTGTEVQIPVPRWRAPRKDRAAWCRGCTVGFGPDVDGFILDPHTYRYLGDLGTMTYSDSTGPGRKKVTTHRLHYLDAVLSSGFVTPGHS